MRKHEKAFSEIKAYYNDITHNNLDLIKALKEDMSDMKKKETASEKLMHEIVAENKKLADSLQNVISTPPIPPPGPLVVLDTIGLIP
jgi:growth arrest-specific protein 8